MNCNCHNLDDESPCKIHNPKMTLPEEVWTTQYRLDLVRRTSNKMYFVNIVKDGVVVNTTADHKEKKEAIKYGYSLLGAHI